MTKLEIIKARSARTGLPQHRSELCLNSLLSIVADALRRGERVAFPGWGSYHVKRYASRAGRDPRNGNPLYIPARRKTVFIPGPALRFPAG